MPTIKHTRYTVLQSRRPACYPMSRNWRNCTFDTYQEALTYVRNWLGPEHRGSIPMNWDGLSLEFFPGESIEIFQERLEYETDED